MNRGVPTGITRPLRHGGAHLDDPDGRWPDIAWRSVKALLLGLLLAACLVAPQWYFLRRSPRPWGASFAVQVVVVCLGVWLVSLSRHYHVLGTDLGGADVAYQSIKGIRTGVLLGTLSTLIMLPIAVTLGVLAGYFKGWVDDRGAVSVHHPQQYSGHTPYRRVGAFVPGLHRP